MDPGEFVVYRQKLCAVLDAKQEGYSLEADHVLLEEVSPQPPSWGRVRYLAQLGALPGSMQVNSGHFQ